MAGHSIHRIGSSTRQKFYVLICFSCLVSLPIRAQTTTSKPQLDILLFKDGEKLIGHLVSSNGDSVVFKSDMAGQVTVAWKNVQELHALESFAVIRKNVSLGRHENPGNIPQGPVHVENDKLEIATAHATEAISVTDTQHLVDKAAFVKATSTDHSIFREWTTSATVGISLVEATQNSQTYTSSVSLSRSFPTVDWMNPENRTLIHFSSSYGNLSQPNTPTVKTDIYHADAERDEYFSPRLYVFGEAAFDRNFSEGLNLQQTYGGGIGLTAIKTAHNEVDLKGELDYLNQQFETVSSNQKLIGSVFSEAYTHTFKHGTVFRENLSISPAWSNTRAYSASGDGNLRFPLFRGIGLTLDVLDNFLNDPSPGFRKNSLQFSTGINYTHK